MAAWSEQIKHCNLILYRATGPYNRSVLFGGKSPPLAKMDPRLRNIPFPTRRATFKEVKRVHDMLSAIEIYGSAEDFKDKFPRSPDNRTTRKESGTLKEMERSESKKTKDRGNREKERSPQQREIPGEGIRSPENSSAEEEEEEECELVFNKVSICFKDLQEFEDTVPECKKKLGSGRQPRSKKKKPKVSTEEKKRMEEFNKIHKNLVKSCLDGDKELLLQCLNIYSTLPEKSSVENDQEQKPSLFLTKEDFIDCLNTATSDSMNNSLLHLAALKGLGEFILLLLEAGADPTLKNKYNFTPYVVADKETRKFFRSFAADFPDKYDFKKANIPEPLTKEMEEEREEKKKEKKKLKRIKEKIKKQENKEKQIEEIEREKFLSLSDREKCALAAERRLVASLTTNMKSAKPPVLFRCFQCGTDITGKIPFEYNNNRFCTIPCLKSHRAKTKNYGIAI